MCGRINNMFAIFCKKATGGPSFSAAYLAVFKFIAGLFRNFTYKHAITVDAFFWIGALKDQPFTISTEIRFGIIATECKLLNVFKMFFFRIMNSIINND